MNDIQPNQERNPEPGSLHSESLQPIYVVRWFARPDKGTHESFLDQLIKVCSAEIGHAKLPNLFLQGHLSKQVCHPLLHRKLRIALRENVSGKRDVQAQPKQKHRFHLSAEIMV
jgi:hypothetical protein